MKSSVSRWHSVLLGTLFVTACATELGSGDPSDMGAPRGTPSTGDSLGAGVPQAELDAMVEQRFQERLAAKKHNEIRGEVRDIDGNELPGVIVRAGGKEVKTDQRGGFTLTELPFDAYVVSFEHPAYVFTQHVVPAWYGNEPYVTATLLARAALQTFNADELTEIEQGPLKLTFEPGDLVLTDTGAPVHGTVEILATPVEPGKKGHMAASPRLEGLDENGKIVGLDSFGMFEVELFQEGRRVQVRPGQTVGMKMNVPPLAGISDSSTIPLWHHDTELGIWVQEPGLRADVHAQEGTLVAMAEMPHFSFWNLDGPKQSLCIVMRLPGATGFRTVSTNGAGAPDDFWSVTGECQGIACVTNAPSGWTTQDNVSFKFQVQIPTSGDGSMWCDARVDIFQTAPPASGVVYGDNLEAYSKQLDSAAPDSSFCGTYNTIGDSITATGSYNAWRTGTFAVPVAAYDPDADGDLIEHLVCPGTPSTVAPDAGFGKMSANALGAYFKDFDRDAVGASDTADSCPASSNKMTCNSSCYVAPGPNASQYDFDGDRIDDLCDSKWTVYNPSQYNGL